VKCVVPIITAWIWPAEASPFERRPFRELRMPPVTSSVVAVLTSARTRSASIRTASVFVPPTSMPILT
jgi:hypothetical protein